MSSTCGRNMPFFLRTEHLKHHVHFCPEKNNRTSIYHVLPFSPDFIIPFPQKQKNITTNKKSPSFSKCFTTLHFRRNFWNPGPFWGGRIFRRFSPPRNVVLPDLRVEVRPNLGEIRDSKRPMTPWPLGKKMENLH